MRLWRRRLSLGIFFPSDRLIRPGTGELPGIPPGFFAVDHLLYDWQICGGQAEPLPDQPFSGLKGEHRYRIIMFRGIREDSSGVPPFPVSGKRVVIRLWSGAGLAGRGQGTVYQAGFEPAGR